MADRKISELNQATRVHDEDYMVVVTGVGKLIPGQTTPVEKVTTKFPLSGLATWIFRVNEVVSGVSGINVIPLSNHNGSTLSARPNSILLSTTGVSFSGHTHTSNDIVNFSNAVNQLVKQDLKVLNNSTQPSVVGEYISLTGTNGLRVNLENNSKYICELGIIVSGNNSSITGMVATSGVNENNDNLISINGTWNYLSGEQPLVYNSQVPMTGSTALAYNILGIHTLVNKFSVSTYQNVGDYISFKFTSNNLDGTILAGSWLKAEKVI